MIVNGIRIERTAGTSLAAMRAVEVSSAGVASYSDPSIAADTFGLRGVLVAAAAANATATIQVYGPLVNNDWAWIPKQKIWAGSGGVLTQTEPAGNVLPPIGIAESANTMWVGPHSDKDEGTAAANRDVIQLTRTAGETLSGHRVVRVSAGNVVYATSATASHANAIIGLTIGAAASGNSITIQSYGPLTEPSWSWTPGAAIYCGVSGVLTQTPPTSGFVRQVAISETATRIFVDLCPPIFLIGS